MSNFEKLNRLRVNAGKKPLKAWKASQDLLLEQIASLEGEGFTDAVPGANINATPVAADPEVAKTLQESALKENFAKEEKEAPKKEKPVARLARGLDTDPMARQSRVAVQMQREKEKREQKASKTVEKKSKKDKKKKDKKNKINPTGAVDPKTDPEKAKRQLKHIEEKRAARAEKSKKASNRNPANGRVKAAGENEITIAEISRELGIDPKVARNKLRRHEDKILKLHTKGQDRWTFPKTAKAEIIKILK